MVEYVEAVDCIIVLFCCTLSFVTNRSAFFSFAASIIAALDTCQIGFGATGTSQGQ